MRPAIVFAESGALRDAALDLLYSQLTADEQEQQIADTLSAVDRREVSLENLIAALDGDQVVATALAIRRPGRTAFLWPPVVREGFSAADVSAALLDTLARRVDAQGVLMTQCLLAPDDAEGRRELESGGFPYTTDLVLLARRLDGLPARADSPDISNVCYTSEMQPAFAEIVKRTYAGSLDCPALAQVRSGEESLDSHRATGEFRPDAWRIYRLHGREVGVALLAEHPERAMWEVAYLGVVPEARGRGLGRAILLESLHFAAHSGGNSIEIAVDGGNSPALALYRGLGFRECRRFAVYLRINR